MPTWPFFLADASHPIAAPVIFCLVAAFFMASALAALFGIRSPGANVLSLVGAAITSGGWFLICITLAVIGTHAPLHSALLGFWIIGLALLNVFGAIPAFVGLATAHRSPGKFRSGIKRGYVAIGLSTLAVVLSFIIIVGIMRSSQERRERSQAGNSAQPAGPVVVQEFNYRITPPPGFAATDAKKLNTAASAAFVEGSPEIFSIIIAEHTAGNRAADLEVMAESLKGRMRSRDQVETAPKETVRFGGLDGLRLESKISKGPVSQIMIHCIASVPGYAYQIISWGPASSLERIRSDNVALRSNFRLLDAPANSEAPLETSAAQPASTVYHSPSYGWSVDLTGTRWHRNWTTMAKSVPGAEWGIGNAADTAVFCVMPLWIGENESDLDSLAAACGSRFGVAATDDALANAKPWSDPKQPQVSGRSFAWEGSRDGRNLLYHFHVIRAKTCTFLTAAWQDTMLETNGDLLDEPIGHLHFDSTSPTPPDLHHLNAREASAHGFFFNALGVNYLNRQQWEPAKRWLQRSVELNDKDATVLSNYISAIIGQGDEHEALEELNKHFASFESNQKLAAVRANLQFSTGDAAGGVKTYSALFDSGYADDKVFANFLRLACEHQQADAASAALDHYAKGRDTPRFRKLRAQLLRFRHEYDQAIAILTDLYHTTPTDNETLIQLALATFSAGRYEESLGYCDKLIEQRIDTNGAQRQRGFALVALKRYREAKDSMEKVCQADPSDAEARRMLDHLAGMLGEGANGAVKTPISPAPLPDELATAPEPRPNDEYLAGFSAYYLQHMRSIAFERGHELKVTDRDVITVLDQQGVQNFSNLEFPFDPFSEEIFVNSLVVKNAKGETISKALVDNSYVADEGVESTATQRKVLHTPVPGLQPGATIECTVTRRETGDAKTFVFRSHILSKSVPVLRAGVALYAAPGTVKVEASPGVTAKKLAEAQCWTIERPEIVRAEPLEAPMEKIYPFVWLADADATWAGEAKSYLDQIKDRRTIDPAVRQAALDATKGVTGDTAKIAALSRLVQQDLAYKGIEFGRRARIPAPAAQTLTNRYGDCKDHALLFSQLLDSVGIPARLAAVSAGMHIRPELPSLDQFNHMVVYLPAAKTGNFIDCTAKYSDLASGGPPDGLTTQQALILDDEHPRLVAIPEYGPGSATAKLEREISVLENAGDLTVKETLTVSGALAVSIRGSLLSVPDSDRKRALLQTINTQLPAIDLQDAQIENLEDRHLPLRVHLQYTAHQRCESAGSHIIVRLPAAWERLFLATRPVVKRYTPFRIWAPVNIDSTTALAIPAGWKAEVPKPRKIDLKFCTGKFQATLSGKTLHLASQVEEKSGEYPAGMYAPFTDSMNSVIGLSEQTILLGK